MRIADIAALDDDMNTPLHSAMTDPYLETDDSADPEIVRLLLEMELTYMPEIAVGVHRCTYAANHCLMRLNSCWTTGLTRRRRMTAA